jgi:hypothetical protein
MPKQKGTVGGGSCEGLTMIADCLSRGLAHPFSYRTQDAEFIILYLKWGGGGVGGFLC